MLAVTHVSREQCVLSEPEGRIVCHVCCSIAIAGVLQVAYEYSLSHTLAVALAALLRCHSPQSAGSTSV